MKKLSRMLYGACALLLASITTTSLMAGASEMAGPYLQISAGANAGVLSGEATNSNGHITEGSLGKLWSSTGIELGYAIPIGDSFLIALGASYQPGKGKISLDPGGGDSGGDSEKVYLSMGDVKIAYIQPMISLSEGSAVYVKWGKAHGDLDWSGDIVDKTINTSVLGESKAIGSRTLFSGTGVYLQTEFGLNDYDEMTQWTALTEGKAVVTPRHVYGKLSLGFKF